MALNVQNVVLRITAGLAKQFPSDGLPQIAFSGRSNVGKSSLINSLLGRKSLARVSSAPGKTVTVNFYEVDKKLLLVDLPGYGFAKRRPEDKAVWSELTDGYFTRHPRPETLKCVLQLIDSRIGPTQDDEMMLDYLSRSGIPFAVIATKCDKLNKTEREETLKNLQSHPLIKQNTPIIFYSALKHEGKDGVWRIIRTAAGL